MEIINKYNYTARYGKSRFPNKESPETQKVLSVDNKNLSKNIIIKIKIY